MKRETQFSRRTMLRGLGVMLSLPWMESLARADEKNDSPPRRMIFMYVPNGVHMPNWLPAEEGPLGELPSTLSPLTSHKDYLIVTGGLTLDGGRSHGDGPGDHARSVGSFLTGAHPKKTDGKDIRNGISVDQVAAAAVGHRTRFPSLELGCEPSAQAGRCDSGYSCLYTSNMSWRTPTSPMSKETNPQAVFDRLLGRPEEGKNASRLVRHRKSVLDLVAEDAQHLQKGLGAADRRKLDEYLYAVRQIERQIGSTEKLSNKLPTLDITRPDGVPKQYDAHVRLMMDMMVLAMACDATRILTFMYTNAGSNRSYPEIGVRAGHHALSHHGNDPKKLAQISQINQHHVSHLAYFLEKLKSVPQSEGHLLDHSMIVYGSGIGDGNRHNHDHLPILLLGKGGGTVRSGRHVRYEKETPLTNLYLSMHHRMGLTNASFSDSTGELEGL